MKLGQPDLVLFCFVPLGPRSGTSGQEHEVRGYLDALWEGWGRLGATQPFGSELPAQYEWPLRPGSRETGLRAAKQHPGRVIQAQLWVVHDAVVFIGGMEGDRSRDLASGWAELDRGRREALQGAEPPQSILGEARVFMGVREDCAVTPNDRLEGAIYDSLPPVPGRSVRTRFYTANPVALWTADVPPLRVMGLVSGRGGEQGDTTPARDGWVWPSLSAPTLPGLARYLLYSAKLDYERRVYESEIQSLRDARKSVDQQVEALIHASERERDEAPDVDELERARAQLSASQAGADGLVSSVHALRKLSRTVEIASANIHAVIPEPWPGWDPGVGSPFEVDRLEAQAVQVQIEHDLGYADEVTGRAEEGLRLADARIERATARHNRRRGRLGFVQGAVVSTLLAALTITQALGTSISVADGIRAPLAATVIALVFSLPFLSLISLERFGPIDLAGAAILGASIGWLIAKSIDGQASGIAVIFAALLGAAVGAVAVRMVNRRFVASS